MKLIYVGGPYRSVEGVYGIKRNIDYAESISAALWGMGASVICPHKNSAFLDGVVEDSVFLMGDLLMLSRCDGMVIIKGWQNSKGTCKEIDMAREFKIPTFEWTAHIESCEHDGWSTLTEFLKS